jgi:two-component system nitrate/nitrite response regulator NarL
LLTIDVLIADAQPLFLDALARAVRQSSTFQLVAEVPDGRGALEAIRRLRPAVALLDLALPHLDGQRVLGAVVRDRIPTAVLLLGTSVGSREAYQAVAEGAAGCLGKDLTADQLRQAIETAARGGTVLGPEALRGVAAEIRLRERGGRPVLSGREQDVLCRMAAGQSTPAIAADLHLGLTTVKTHTAHLYEKLGVRERAAAVAEGMRRGLLE